MVLLDAGRIVADGTHTELLDRSTLYVEVLAQAEAEEREQLRLERDRETERLAEEDRL